MRKYVSEKASQISKSQTLAISAQAKKMREEGMSIIGFTAGEPDCNTPEYIIDAAKAALDAGKTKYTPSAGTEALRKAIAKKLLEENGLEYSFKNIVVSNGGKHALFNALYAIINDGDEVIIPAPYWLTYPELVKICGGKPVILEGKKENGFKITAEELKNAITDKTKAVIINSPNNPTGAVYTKEHLYSLAKVLEEKEIITISDEIYEKLYYGEKPISIATYSEKMKELTIVVNGLSKSYAMTGWRVGYIAANDEIATAIDYVQSHMTSNVNSIAQEASKVAFSRTEDVEELRAVYDSRRRYMVERIKTMDKISCLSPDGAFYIFVDISKVIGKEIKGQRINGSLDFCRIMLDYGVALIPGAPFGADDHVRLSFAVSEEDIAVGLNRIERMLNDVK